MSPSPALGAYLLASRLAGLLAAPILRHRLRQGKEDAARLSERLGIPGLPRPAGRLIWLHGASVGEATSMLPLIAALGARGGTSILATTGTLTSARRMQALLPDGPIHQFVPVDTRRAVRRFLDHWRPDLAVWIESEIWPRLVVETAARGVPMALVNARLSQASCRRWRWLPAMARRLFGSFRMIEAQDPETVGRLCGLGVAARFGGNLKALAPPPDCDAGELAALRRALRDRPIWLAASTHPGEEPVMASAHERLPRVPRRPLLILAPRHPERGGEVARLLGEAGFGVSLRSAGAMPTDATDVWLADTLGEMGLWYRLAGAAFVGGSLVRSGGHTPFEPLQLGCPVLHGPHVENFAPAYAALSAGGGAVSVADAGSLADAIGQLLADPSARQALSDRARTVHDRLKPDIDALAATLSRMMDGGA